MNRIRFAVPSMKLFFILLSWAGWSCSVPPETANRHYTISVANLSDLPVYVGFSRSWHGNPSSGGVVDYAQFKFDRSGSVEKPEDYLVRPGEINRKALDIGSDDGYNTIEHDMKNCNWYIHFVDANVVDKMTFEELNDTQIGVLLMKEYTLQDIRNMNFTITYFGE